MKILDSEKEARSGQRVCSVQGFLHKLGWRRDEIECAAGCVGVYNDAVDYQWKRR